MTRKVSTLLLALLLLLAHATPARAAAPAAASFSTAVAVSAPTVLQLQGSDADGTPLIYATPGLPSHGTLSQLNTATGAVVYTPTAGYTGSDSFTYTVTSGGDTTAAATVTITVTASKTRIIDTLTNPDSSARSGKVTFILTKAASSPSGLIPANATVSAVLSATGQFDVSVYPSRAVSPVQYYQVWFEDAVSKNTQMLGVYDIPASTTTISLTGRRVTDTNLAAQYTFASKAEVDAVWAAAAAALVPAQIFPGITSGNVPFWNGTAFANSALSQSGSTVTAAGPVNVSGVLTVSGTISGTLNGNAATATTAASAASAINATNATNFIGSGSTSNAVDLATAEVAGTLPNARTTAAMAATAATIVERDSGGAVNASGLKINDTQVVGAQGFNIPDPDGTVEGNTEAIKALLVHFRGWGSLSNLYRSTLNDGLVSLWLLNNVNDAHGSNHLTNIGAVTFNSAGANFSGSNHLSVANNSSFQISHNQSFTFATRVRLNTKATTQAILSKTDGISANEYSLVYASAADGIDRFRFNVYPGGTSQVGVSATSAGSPSTATDYLLVAWYDAWAHQICIQANNGTADCAAATLTSHPYTAQFAIGSLSVPGPSIRLNGSVRFVGFWSKELSAEERAELYDNQAALTYPLKDDTTARTTHILQPYNFFDNRAPAHAAAEAGYIYALPYSRAAFTTTATSMDVEVWSTNNEVEPAGRYLNVRVNGADHGLILAPQSTGASSTHTVVLPAGAKTVEVWNGFQYLSGGLVKGSWGAQVTFNAAARAKTPDDKSPHLVILGDSISAGAGASIPTRTGWSMLLRDAYPGSVAVEAWGGRSLAQDASNGTTRAQLVARIATQQPDAFLSMIGTNDYGGVGFGEQSAASFGTNLGAFLDDLHAASPSTTIHAASMLPRTSTGANAYGNTLADYRSQVQTVCAARAWCTFIDGSAVPGFNTGTDLFDTVHLNDSGNAKVFNYVKTFFGL